MKEQQKAEAANEEKDYANFVDEVEAIRLEAEMEAQRQARMTNMETFAVNRGLADARAMEATDMELAQKALGEAEVEREINSKWLNEDPSQAVSAANPNRYRTDHFKGFAPEVVDKIIHTVDSQLADKAAVRKAEVEEKEMEANFDDQIRDIMAEQNYTTKIERATVNASYRDDILRQIEEKKAREAEEKAYYKKVAIQEGGLLSGFGKSYR